MCHQHLWDLYVFQIVQILMVLSTASLMVVVGAGVLTKRDPVVMDRMRQVKDRYKEKMYLSNDCGQDFRLVIY